VQRFAEVAVDSWASDDLQHLSSEWLLRCCNCWLQGWLQLFG
jgi:hypothetical protein